MSLNDRLAAFFKAHPNEWIDGRELAKVAGCYAWRSRVSDLRRTYPTCQYGMNIEWRQRRSDVPLYGSFVISEYRYVPPAETQPSASDGHDLNVPWSLR